MSRKHTQEALCSLGTICTARMHRVGAEPQKFQKGCTKKLRGARALDMNITMQRAIVKGQCDKFQVRM